MCFDVVLLSIIALCWKCLLLSFYFANLSLFIDDFFLAVSFILSFIQSFHSSYVKFYDLFLFFCSAPPFLWVTSDFYFQRYVEISASVFLLSHLVAAFLLINICTTFILDCRFSDLWHWVKWVKGWCMFKIGNVLGKVE